MGRPSRHRWIQVGGEGGSKKNGSWNRKKINGKENRSNKKKKRLACGAAEARARVFPMKGHGKPLAEHDGAGAFSLELAGSQG